MPPRDGPHKLPQARYKLPPTVEPVAPPVQYRKVPITQLTPEQIAKYAPETDIHAPGAAFRTVDIPIEQPPKKAPVVAKAAPKPPPDPKSVLNDMLVNAFKKLNAAPVETADLKKSVDTAIPSKPPELPQARGTDVSNAPKPKTLELKYEQHTAKNP